MCMWSSTLKRRPFIYLALAVLALGAAALIDGCATARVHRAASALVASYCDLPILERRAFRTAFNARSAHKVVIECAGDIRGPLSQVPEERRPEREEMEERAPWKPSISQTLI